MLTVTNPTSIPSNSHRSVARPCPQTTTIIAVAQNDTRAHNAIAAMIRFLVNSTPAFAPAA
jgi:hypothetical protein